MTIDQQLAHNLEHRLIKAVVAMRHGMQADPKLTRVSQRAQDAINEQIVNQLALVLSEMNQRFDYGLFEANCLNPLSEHQK